MENSVPVKKERNYGIELLRLVLMFMVCVLHTCGQGGILQNAKVGSMTYYGAWFLEIISYYAVNAFAIISGYTTTGKKRNYSRLISIWFQVFFYSFGVSCILTFIGIGNFTPYDLLQQATPLLSNLYWYFTAYVALFVLSPFIDKAIAAIDEKYAIKFLIVIILFFSVIPMFAVGDIFSMHSGYSAIWLIICYAMGALAKKGNFLETTKTPIIVAIWFSMSLITWLLLVTGKTGALVNYISPTMVIAALTLVIIFSRFKLKGTLISRLSPLAFGVYLFHLNTIIWYNIVKDLFADAASYGAVRAMLTIFLGASTIFISGLIVEFIRSSIAKLIRLPQFCDFLARLGGRAVTWIASKVK